MSFPWSAQDRDDKTVDFLHRVMTLGQVESAAGVHRLLARAAALSLLWYRIWTVDLSKPVSDQSVLEGVRPLWG